MKSGTNQKRRKNGRAKAQHAGRVNDLKQGDMPQSPTRRWVLEYAAGLLAQQGIEEAKLDARCLLQFVSGLTRAELLFDGGKELSSELAERFFVLVRKRAAHIPLQYLTGEQEFMGLAFKVTPEVLIPRQDTERLVEAVLPHCAGKRVLDVCTGSGCIAVSIAKLGNAAYVAGCDISEGALAIARENADVLGAKVDFFRSDLFSGVTERFDVLVSNPPYIKSSEIDALMPEVRCHEPRLALDGREDGLHFYREIITGAKEHLMPGGRLFFEIGCDQAEDVGKLLEQHGFAQVKVLRDYAGLDRVVSAVDEIFPIA